MPGASVKVHLDYDFTTNGETIPAGTQDVPAEMVDELVRRNAEYNKYKRGITEKRVYTHNAGITAVGEAAE